MIYTMRFIFEMSPLNPAILLQHSENWKWTYTRALILIEMESQSDSGKSLFHTMDDKKNMKQMKRIGTYVVVINSHFVENLIWLIARNRRHNVNS